MNRRRLLILLLLLWLSPSLLSAEPSSLPEAGEGGESADDTPTPDAEDDPASAELEPVTVQGRRNGTEGRRVERLNARRIKESGAQTAADVLDLSVSTSVGVNARGEQKFTLRGFDQRQVLTLIDGLPLSSPYTGVTDVGRFPAEILEGVELVKGSSALRYGAQGLGGAVNLITRAPGKGPRFLTVYESDFLHSNRLGFSTSGSRGAFAWLAAAGFRQSSGFPLSADFTPARNEDGGTRDNADRFDWHGVAKGRVDLTSLHHLEAGLSFVQGESGAPPHTSSRSPRYWRWPLWRDINAYLTHVGRWTPKLRTDETVYAVMLTNTLDSYDSDLYTTQLTPGAFTSTYRDYLMGGRVRARVRLPSGKLDDLALRLVAGVRYERHESEDTGKEDAGAVDQVQFQAAPELAIIWSRLIETRFGFMVDTNTPLESGNETHADTMLGWGPLVSVLLHPHRRVDIDVTAARQVRFPTLSERFGSKGAQRVPNPDLVPEHAWNTSLDLVVRPHDVLEIRVGGYESEVRQLLEERFFGGGVSGIVNGEDLRILGAELEAEVKLPHGIRIGAGYGFLHYWRLGEGETPYLTYRPAHKAALRFYARPWRIVGLGTEARVVGPQYYQADDSGRWGKLGAYGDWALRLDIYPTDIAKLWLRASNLLDMDYQPYHGQPAAGRQIFAGVELRTD